MTKKISVQLSLLNLFTFLCCQVDGFTLRSPQYLFPLKKHDLRQKLESNVILKAEQSDDSDLILSSDESNSILTSAFAALNEEEKYDTVLTGLCAKILDGQTDAESEGGDELKGPMDLMNEMNSRRVKASPRSLSALVDVGAKSESAVSMSNILSLCIRNNGIRNYGSFQNTIKALPRFPSGDLPAVPSDNRGVEISSAVAVSITTLVCLALSNRVGSGPTLTDLSSFSTDLSSYSSTLASLILNVLGIAAIVDNGYDALKALGKTVTFVSQQKVKIPELPPKEEMPLGIGKGEISGTVVAGFSRLLSVDTERECRCEAASFFTAYSLGLPCFSFRPNSLEAVVLIFESVSSNESDEKTSLDPLLSSAGILKILVWLFSPVAMENMKYPQLIGSDPREATGLLTRLEKSCFERDIDFYSILPYVETDKEYILRWAYREAERLLVRNKNVCEALEERLAGGAATVGDCVAVLEGWE